jgi:cytochrome c biogenesis protein CcdA
MTLFIVSFVAGVLTILAPCVLPLIPIIIGGSLGRAQQSWKRPLIITASLAVSIIVFTLLLKSTTLLLGIPTTVWSVISGIIIILFGVSMLKPHLWEEVMIRSRLQALSSRLLGATTHRKTMAGDVLLGAALGPVFSSCSPTFALIVAAVLPVDFTTGILYLLAYAVGLSLSLLLAVLVGQSALSRLGWALQPRGTFVKVIGISFIIVGIVILLGFDKTIQTRILDAGWYDPISSLEQRLR